MPFDTKEKKAAWRRRNREQNAAYLAEWKRRKREADPGYFERLKDRAKAKRDAARVPRRCVCGTEFLPAERRRYCSPECRPKPTPKPRVSIYERPWTGDVVGRLAESLNRRSDNRNWPGTWGYKVQVLTRGLRFMRKIVRFKKQLTFDFPPTWEETSFRLACVVNHRWSANKPRHLVRPVRSKKKALRRVWMPRCTRISKSLRSRCMAEGVRPKIRPSDVMGLLKAQGFRCALTGDELTPDNTSADHKVPVSRGGCHDLSNIALVTGAANVAKGTMTVEEFVELCRKVVRHFDGQREETDVE